MNIAFVSELSAVLLLVPGMLRHFAEFLPAAKSICKGWMRVEPEESIHQNWQEEYHRDLQLNEH